MTRILKAWPVVAILVWELIQLAQAARFSVDILSSFGRFLGSPKGDLIIALLAVAVLLVVVVWPKLTQWVPFLGRFRDRRVDDTVRDLRADIKTLQTIVEPLKTQEDVRMHLRVVEDMQRRLTEMEKRSSM